MTFSIILDNIRAALEITAILVAGIWAYCKFVKGRLFKHKLDTELSAKLISLETGDHILVSMDVKNCGYTRIGFEGECCVLRIFIPKDRPNQDFTDATIWRRVATVPILTQHKWIEPSEAIHEEKLIRYYAPANLAARIEVSISDSHVLWRASTVSVRPNSGQVNERRLDYE